MNEDENHLELHSAWASHAENEEEVFYVTKKATTIQQQYKDLVAVTIIVIIIIMSCDRQQHILVVINCNFLHQVMYYAIHNMNLCYVCVQIFVSYMHK